MILRERNGLEREREKRILLSAAAEFDFCAKRWSAEIKTRVNDLAGKFESARADSSFRSGGFSQQPQFSSNFDR